MWTSIPLSLTLSVLLLLLLLLLLAPQKRDSYSDLKDLHK